MLGLEPKLRLHTPCRSVRLVRKGKVHTGFEIRIYLKRETSAYWPISPVLIGNFGMFDGFLCAEVGII